jgi:hypothetical protein
MRAQPKQVGGDQDASHLSRISFRQSQSPKGTGAQIKQLGFGQSGNGGGFGGHEKILQYK